MIKFENTEVAGLQPALRGMRNPLNSWDRRDSEVCHILGDVTPANEAWRCAGCKNEEMRDTHTCVLIGPNDMSLCKRLRNAGTEHRKYLRMIQVWVDITAPLYWWKEFDTYKVGTVANSCSTMHKIGEKEFVYDDFSHEHLYNNGLDLFHVEWDKGLFDREVQPMEFLTEYIVPVLNKCREKYLEAKTKPMKDEPKRADLVKGYWWQMIQLLPSSYNQKRTVMLNYEVLANIYRQRKNHKLDEWRQFCDWIRTLPYSELIAGEENK